MTEKVHDQPSEVYAEDGVVLVEGPDGVAHAFTPPAAEETSQRLLVGAMAANGQRAEQEQHPRR
jgi:hypothetical protein